MKRTKRSSSGRRTSKPSASAGSAFLEEMRITAKKHPARLRQIADSLRSLSSCVPRGSRTPNWEEVAEQLEDIARKSSRSGGVSREVSWFKRGDFAHAGHDAVHLEMLAADIEYGLIRDINKLIDYLCSHGGPQDNGVNSDEGLEWIDGLQRARAELVRLLAGPEAREAEYRNALELLARPGGCGMLDMLRRLTLDAAIVDDRNDGTPGEFYTVDGHTLDEIGTEDPKAGSVRAVGTPAASRRR